MCSNSTMFRLFTSRGLFFCYNKSGFCGKIERTLCLNLKECLDRNFHSNSTCLFTRNENNTKNQLPLKESVLKKPSEDVVQLLENAASFQDQLPQTKEQVWSTAPYPKGAIPRSQASYSLRPNIDPKETTILLFPGQGSQFVGMGKRMLKVPIVQDLFDHASEILGYDLLKLCLYGPKEELDKTVHCQVAILVCSMAAVEQLKDDMPSVIENCIAAAGFSVGEITALTFAGVISFERAVRLVKVRAEAMQIASEMQPGGMMTVFYGPDSKLKEACTRAREWAEANGVEQPVCSVANYLFPDCKVLAGHNEALEFIEKNMKQFNLRRVKRLPVSGAFHTPLMQPAIEPFKTALRKVKLEEPMIAVHSNVDGKMYKNSESIHRLLPRQIVSPVKWEQTLHILYERPDGENFPATFECGPGNSLKTILKMVNAKAADFCKNVAA